MQAPRPLWTFSTSKRGSRGGGERASGPPWGLSKVETCAVVWWIGEGVQQLCLPCYHQFFFLARFARQYFTNILHVYILPSSMFSMESSSFFYISLIQIMKRIQLTIPYFIKGYVHIFGLELHDLTPFKPKILLGEDPPSQYTYNIKTNMPSVCFCRNDHSLPTIHLFGKSISTIFLQKGKRNRITKTLCFLSSSFFLIFFYLFIFFLLVKNFRKVGPPWRKFLDPRLNQIHFCARLVKKPTKKYK